MTTFDCGKSVLEGSEYGARDISLDEGHRLEADTRTNGFKFDTVYSFEEIHNF